jgi:hypothetical protein
LIGPYEVFYLLPDVCDPVPLVSFPRPGCFGHISTRSQVFECSGGVVSDQETAIRITEAILFPVYGEDSIREQGPYQVNFKDGKWTVEGTAPDLGGWRFRVVILQVDGRILEIGSAR